MYRTNQLWIVGEEDLKDMLTPMLTPGAYAGDAARAHDGAVRKR